MGEARWLPLFAISDVPTEIINTVLRSAAVEKQQDEAFENRWSLLQHPSQTTASKPSIAPIDSFDNGFANTSIKSLQHFVETKCGENGLGDDRDVYMDWLADDAFGVIDARTAQDDTILFCAREAVDAIQEAEVRMAWNKGTRSDELLSKYIRNAEELNAQEIKSLVENLTNDQNVATETRMADFDVDGAKQKISDWIDAEQ